MEVLTEWLEEEPGNPIAVHMLAAATGRNVPAARVKRVRQEHIRQPSPQSFEARLESLCCCAPKLDRGRARRRRGFPADQRLDVLDAVSDLGLCGPLLAPYASRLAGVDLSSGMLQHARSKNAVLRTGKMPLTAYLRARPEEFDVVVAADTLVYFGDLREFSAAAARALRPSGVLAFTLEHAVDAADGYRLELHGRYSHDRRYAEQTLLAAGLRPQSSCAELRMELAGPVAGLVMRGFKDRSARRVPRPVITVLAAVAALATLGTVAAGVVFSVPRTGIGGGRPVPGGGAAVHRPGGCHQAVGGAPGRRLARDDTRAVPAACCTRATHRDPGSL